MGNPSPENDNSHLESSENNNSHLEPLENNIVHLLNTNPPAENASEQDPEEQERVRFESKMEELRKKLQDFDVSEEELKKLEAEAKEKKAKKKENQQAQLNAAVYGFAQGIQKPAGGQSSSSSPRPSQSYQGVAVGHCQIAAPPPDTPLVVIPPELHHTLTKLADKFKQQAVEGPSMAFDVDYLKNREKQISDACANWKPKLDVDSDKKKPAEKQKGNGFFKKVANIFTRKKGGKTDRESPPQEALESPSSPPREIPPRECFDSPPSSDVEQARDTYISSCENSFLKNESEALLEDTFRDKQLGQTSMDETIKETAPTPLALSEKVSPLQLAPSEPSRPPIETPHLSSSPGIPASQLVEEANIATQYGQGHDINDVQRTHFQRNVVERGSGRGKEAEHQYGAMHTPVQKRKNREMSRRREDSSDETILASVGIISSETPLEEAVPVELAQSSSKVNTLPRLPQPLPQQSATAEASQLPEFAHLRPKPLNTGEKKKTSLPKRKSKKRPATEWRESLRNETVEDPLANLPLAQITGVSASKSCGQSSTQSSSDSQGSSQSTAQWLAERGTSWSGLNRDLQQKVLVAFEDAQRKEAAIRPLEKIDEVSSTATSIPHADMMGCTMFTDNNLQEDPPTNNGQYLETAYIEEMNYLNQFANDVFSQDLFDDSQSTPIGFADTASEYSEASPAQCPRIGLNETAREYMKACQIMHNDFDEDYISKNVPDRAEQQSRRESSFCPPSPKKFDDLGCVKRLRSPAPQGEDVPPTAKERPRERSDGHLLNPAIFGSGTKTPAMDRSKEAYCLTSRKGTNSLYMDRESVDGVLGRKYQQKCVNTDGSISCVCSGCKAFGCSTRIKLINGRFVFDPSTLKHHSSCHPVVIAEELAKGLYYKKIQDLKNKEVTGGKPKEIYRELLVEGNNMDGITNAERSEVVKAFNAYPKVRRTIQRAKRNNYRINCTMGNIPDELKTCEIRSELGTNEKEKFVQFSSGTRLLCFSRQIFRTAKEKNVTTIISDGCHGLAPSELDDNSQLYTVHGSTDSGATIELLNFVTTSKSAATYTKMFKILRKELEEAGFDVDKLNFMTDYERAAIKAIEEVFPNSTHDGCSYHLAQTLNRAISGAMRDLMKRNRTVHRWFRRLIALVFFPPDHLKKTGLLQAPEGLDEAETRIVEGFLKYYKGNWIDGYFKGKWNKWLKFENRTSNMAESYHSKLQDTLGVSRPNLAMLLTALRGELLTSYAAFCQAAAGHPFPVAADWDHCRGSTGQYRGYTCGLWTSFHTLTVSAYKQAAATNLTTFQPLVALQAIRDWVGSFFGCQHCRDHFLKMTTNTFKMEAQIGHSEIYLGSAHVYCKTVSIKSYEVIDRTYPSPYYNNNSYRRLKFRYK